MPEAEGGGIFVSYRRQQSSDIAGRLSDRLADRFGEEQVFIDVDTIKPGVDLAEEISRAVAICKVLLAVIGPNWLTATDERGRRRLDNPDDIVRLEIEAALARNVRVIPILVAGAGMPGRQDLPESLAGLAGRNALFIRHETFRDDAARLVTEIEGIVHTPASARAIRVLADAERIAQSLTNGYEKASALTSIARVMASTDRGRAARLIADAKRTAQAITIKDQKASALAGIAKALAATDPDHAAGFIDDAERTAQAITDAEAEAWKASALAGIPEAIAATDPGRAERIAQAITNEYWQACILAGVAKVVAATDRGRATRLIDDAEHTARRNDDYGKARALTSIAEAIADIDPRRSADLIDEAERTAQSITGVSTKAIALAGIAKVIAATDRDRAAWLIDDAERTAQSITDKDLGADLKARALFSMVEALAATDPDRAERIAQSITVDWYKARALATIAEALLAQA
jgi:hypothetical protein